MIYQRNPEIQAAYDEYKIKLAGRCPFCLLNPEVNKIIEENSKWLVMLNAFPYENIKTHLLFCLKSHVEDICDGRDWMSLYPLLKKYSSQYPEAEVTFK